MPVEPSAPPPVPFLKLKDIVHGACDETFATVTAYDHTRTEGWNSQIISTVLSSLLSATTPPNSSQPPYKYSIHSTIIQYLPSPSPSSSSTPQNNTTTYTSTSTSTSTSDNPSNPTGSQSRSLQPPPSSSSSSKEAVGRRGMHAAAGAYWDNTRDGMWSYKYEAAGGKGLDVMVAVIWIWVGESVSTPGPGSTCTDAGAGDDAGSGGNVAGEKVSVSSG